MRTVSDKQLAANRANAARSTGPRSPEGKARAALNSRKHGLSASTFTAIGLEDPAELEALIADAVDYYRPENSQEQFAVERIALCQLSILRAYRLEAGSIADAHNAIPSPHREQYDDTELLGQGFQLRAFRGHNWPLLLRYQAQADRQYRRAVEDFQRLKRERDDIPNEPISEATKPDTPTDPDRHDAPSPTDYPENSGFLRVSAAPRPGTASPPHELLK